MEEGVTLTDHPPYSPDFNGIEGCWGEVKRTTWDQGPLNNHELAQRLEDAWREFTHPKLNAHVKSMQRRLQQCIDRNGKPTDY